MHLSKRYFRLTASASVLAVAFTTPAYAYLDPGTASIVLQSIVAAFAAGAATIGIYWNKIRGLFGSKSKQSDDKGKN